MGDIATRGVVLKLEEIPPAEVEMFKHLLAILESEVTKSEAIIVERRAYIKALKTFLEIPS